MITVWKYELDLVDHQAIELPSLSKPLHAGYDGEGKLVLWVLVNTDENELVKHGFRIAGTGHEISKPIPSYLNTVTSHGGEFFWHVFWEGSLYDFRTR